MAEEGANIKGLLHVDRYLTDFSVMFVQDRRNFMGQMAASVIPVTKQSDIYVTYDRGYFWRDEAAPRPLGGRPRQVGYSVGSGSYNCVEYALEHIVDDRQRANADAPLRLDENATTLLTSKMMIKQDRLWATANFNGTTWSTNRVGVASGMADGEFLQFNDAASDPIGIIDETKDSMHELTGFMPNTLVLGAKVKRILRSHPDIADRIKYTGIGIADESKLAELFEVENVFVARSIYNAAAEGDANDFNYIIDKNAIWLGYIERNPGLDSPTAVANFAWTGLIPGATNSIGGVMERGRDDRAHSDYFQCRMAFDIRLVAADLGVFMTDATLPS